MGRKQIYVVQTKGKWGLSGGTTGRGLEQRHYIIIMCLRSGEGEP